MPYDPYAQPNPWWQQQQGPQQGAQFGQPPAPQQPKPWWQGVPMAKSQVGKSSDQSGQSPNQLSPGLLQMLMLGGKPTYNGTPTGSGAPGGATSPWSWMGSMFGGPAR